MRRLSLSALVGVILASAGLTASAQTGDDVLARAMADEMARSMPELHRDQLARPYFISYAVHDIESRTVMATGGCLSGRDVQHGRYLTVEVRVGDYKFDNSNFMAGGNIRGIAVSSDPAELFGGLELPLDGNYREIRRQIWLSTDAAYKEAAEALASKRAALLNRGNPDTLPDFLPEPATHTVDDDPVQLVADADLDSLARSVSRAAALPFISTSSATASVTTDRTHYLNSEGTSYVRSRQLIALDAGASTQAVDGMPLSDGVSFGATAMQALRAADVAARMRAIVLHLDSLRRAPLVGRYIGPVLFEGRAAAQLFRTEFGSAVAGRRRMGAGGEMGAYINMAGMGSLNDRIGGRVLPDFLTVVDDPTRAAFGATPLLGGYKVDDEGVTAHATMLVDGGILKSVLTTRTPVDGVDHSTGNDRGGTAGPSNLFVTATGGLRAQELRARLLAAAAKRGLPYAIVVRDLGEGGAVGSPDQMMFAMAQAGGRGTLPLLAIYRLYPDGREELARGAVLTDLTLASFKDIVAAGDSAIVYQQPRGTMARNFAMMAAMMTGRGFAFSPTTVSSYVVPSLLFDELTILQAPRSLPDLPFSPPPEASKL